MTQANLMAACPGDPLPFLPFPCSMARPMRMSSAIELRIGQAMNSAGNTRMESDARRSALMAAAQAGDRVAYATLLRDCVPFIAGLARRRGVPPDRTDDVVQETLLTLHRARATYDPRRSFDAWLRVIVERRAIDILRQIKRRGAREVHAPLAYERHPADAVDPSAAIEQQEKARRIGTALAELPRRQREAVQHLMLNETTLADAAALTGRSKIALKVNLHRALNALRHKIGRRD
jgi:RNA polymerase sigma factor (sigma-70 family)